MTSLPTINTQSTRLTGTQRKRTTVVWLSDGGERMGPAPADPDPPDSLSDALIQQIDSLDLPELKALISYVERRLEELRTPLEEEIEANAAGKILEIDMHGPYALVRQHPPNPEGTGVNSDVISLYHVRRENQLDGTESLNWAYLGDVNTSATGGGNTREPTRCLSCGARLDTDGSICPHCGSDTGESTRPEDEQ